jgi:hypothetical protein
VALTGFTLRLAFHPGSSNWSTRPYLTLVAGDEANTTTWQLLEASGSRAAVNLSLPTWQTIEVPLAQVSGTITEIRLRGSAKGTFYLDDLRLVAAKPSVAPGTAVLESQTSPLPAAFSLAQNYPNPFNGSTVIRFSLPRAGEVEAAIYDLVGQQVATLAQGARPAGTHLLTWDGRDDQGRLLASGIYLYRLEAGGFSQSRRMLLLR